MFPIGFGSQTAASVTRPAAYCGAVGYKATTGAFDLQGVCGLAASYDTLGFLCREIEDVSLMREALLGDRPPPQRADDSAAAGGLRPHAVVERGGCRHPPRPRVGRRETGGRGGGCDGTGTAGGVRSRRLVATHKLVMAFDAARARAYEYANHPDELSPQFTALMEEGRAVPYADYRVAQERSAACRRRLADLMSGFDVLLAPSAPGEAPEGHAATGDPLFSRMWTLLHVPSVTLPVAAGDSGLPIGVQVVGKARGDGALLADARWIYDRLR